MHWTGQYASLGRVDALVAPETDPVSGQPGLKYTPVAVRPYTAAWYGFAVMREAPGPVPAGYWALAHCTGGWRVELADTEAPADWTVFARALLAPGRASCPQADINALMVKLARQGKRVVRLKSGDPMIFGRAGEEIARLERESIPVSVIPGITAALAAAAFGISLTHRDQAHSVRFVTGYSKKGGFPENLDWRGLADPETSLIFYMGGRTAARVAERLIAHGLPVSTPVAVAASVSRPDEQRRAGRLSDLTDGSPFGTDGPVLIGIGVVFAEARVLTEAEPSARTG